jgi:hypothetical protein
MPKLRQVEEFEPLQISTPNKAWVVKEFDKLLDEWRAWNESAKSFIDSADYNQQTCSEAVKDGWENLKKHEILREKTLVFLRNNFMGSGFIFENWPTHPHESNTSRLRDRVPNWVHRLEILQASIGYARVPEGFWKEKGKELVTAITKLAPEKATEVAASYLKNPMS